MDGWGVYIYIPVCIEAGSLLQLRSSFKWRDVCIYMYTELVEQDCVCVYLYVCIHIQVGHWYTQMRSSRVSIHSVGRGSCHERNKRREKKVAERSLSGCCTQDPPLPSSFFFFWLLLLLLFVVISIQIVQLQQLNDVGGGYLAFFVVHSFIEIRPLLGEFPVEFPFFCLQWNHRRCALSKLRVEMRRNWKGGPTYKKGRTTRTRGSMKRFDVGYTLRKRDGQTICQRGVEPCVFYFSLPTNKRYESVVACAHHHLILFFLAVKVYPFLCCFISLIGSLSSPPGQHSSMGIDSRDGPIQIVSFFYFPTTGCM